MFGYSVTAVAAGDARNDGYCDAADYDDDAVDDFQKAVLQYEVSLYFDVWQLNHLLNHLEVVCWS